MSNEYGSAVKTIELPPDYWQSGLADPAIESPSDCLIEIFSLDGCLIGKVRSVEEVYATLKSGIYIIREVYTHHSVKIRKIVVSSETR